MFPSQKVKVVKRSRQNYYILVSILIFIQRGIYPITSFTKFDPNNTNSPQPCLSMLTNKANSNSYLISIDIIAQIALKLTTTNSSSWRKN